ncbi:HD domain-containing phosphohydrolase [Schlesneria paludicola]|uniref:HD domain-containing phosphohydrolase n=1 Tax=Schlesneria paludicola TaxID=360056 RepID=UPI0012F72E79|nr:HD domain-containing phosphohydrolase [Schlesneria paludicola]
MGQSISAMSTSSNVEKLLDDIEHGFSSLTQGGETRFGAKAFPPAVDAEIAAQTKILIVDDEPINVKVCQKYLNELGYKRCIGLSDATRAVSQIAEEMPDLVILDVMMPVVSGVDILRQLRSKPELSHIPVLILTASTDRSTKLTVLEYGASDFLTKPIDPSELAPRVRNVLTVKQHQDSLKNYAQTLEAAVQQRTLELEASRQDVIFCLARAVEYRDDVTGRHVERVGQYAGLIGLALGWSEHDALMLEQAAQLHDVGKVGVPDEVLLKPGKLTPEEFEQMQRHTLFGKRIVERMGDRESTRLRQHVLIGSRILDVPRSPLLTMAARIALTHHERWDGTGYPLGLAGEDIPIEGRITAVADVFDALSSRRPYKPAYPISKCFEIITNESGSHFDPKIVDTFISQRDLIVQTQIELADPE